MITPIAFSWSIAGLACAALLACDGGEPAPPPATVASVPLESSPTPVAQEPLIVVRREAVDSGSGNDPTAFFDRVRELDLNGDGQPDSLRLRARGVRADSLWIELIAVINGDTVPIDDWPSSAELMDPSDAARKPGPELDSFIRDRLVRVLGGASTEPFQDSTLHRPWVPSSAGDCEEDVHNCIVGQLREAAHPGVTSRYLTRSLPFDTAAARAIVADIAANADISLHFAYGYESIYSVVYSARAKRFFVVWSCC